MTSIEFIVCLLLVGISSFLSTAEVALFSLSRMQLKTLKENFSKSFSRIDRMLSDPRGILLTILLLNEVVNVSLATVIANVISRSWETQGWLARTTTLIAPDVRPWIAQTVVGLIVISPIILFLCEIPPKVIGAKLNRVIASLTSGPLFLTYRAFAPMRFLFERAEKLVVQIIKPAAQSVEEEESTLKEEDFLMMVEDGRREGMIKESEVELIRNIFRLDDVFVRDIMTHLNSVYCLPQNCRIRDAIQELKNRQFYRVPVYGKNKRDIVGILFAKDLVHTQTHPETLSEPITTLMRKPFFVRAGLRVNTLFRRLKQYQTHMAVVRDRDKDSVIGIVTMDDVLDEIFSQRSLN